MPKTRPALERFLEKVRIPVAGGCWLWIGAQNGRGYGVFGIGGGSRSIAKAHRWAYEKWVCKIPAGLQIDHLCRQRSCVNPKHLETVTQQENIRRGEGGRHNKQKTHCPKSHPYNEANTWLHEGRRYCRPCNRERLKLYHRKSRAAARAKSGSRRPRPGSRVRVEW